MLEVSRALRNISKFQDFCRQKKAEPDRSALLLTPAKWARTKGILLDGCAVDFKNHPYQVAILNETARRQCMKKGAQVGLTSAVMLKTMHGLITQGYPQGVLYLFPTTKDATDFAKGRLGPLIKENPSIFAHVHDVDAATIKRFGRSTLYIRGAGATHSIRGRRSSSQLKSIPVDRICFDEYDEMDADMIDLARQRVAHSMVKEEIYLSTPSLHDCGIDALFKQSDQRFWYLRCGSCGRWTCLEHTFPDCLVEAGGKVIRACSHCRAELDPRRGRWQAECPDRSKDLVGWHISQLSSPFVDPAEILRAFHNPPNGRLQEVFNSMLGEAYDEEHERLSMKQVLECCGSEGIAASDRGPCSMGVDVGGTDLHVVIGRPHDGKAGQIVHLGVYKEWDELDKIVRRFNVVCCVIDGQPERHFARAFAQRFPQTVYLCFYNDHQKNNPMWNRDQQTVTVNRTESYEASHNQIIDRQIVLPKESDPVREFAKHLNNAAKRLVEDKRTGDRRYEFFKPASGSPDHFRAAFNYECLARATLKNRIFLSCFT
jgi:Phage terminase large subunit (GpA)